MHQQEPNRRSPGPHRDATPIPLCCQAWVAETSYALRRRRQATDPELDVRSEPPARRHQLIFATYEALAAGEGFVLVNDHDPKPLEYQFAAERPAQYTWDYLEQGPEVWRVRIGKPEKAAA